MGDYEPRGSTDSYGDKEEPPAQQTVGADGHAVPPKEDRNLALFAHLGAMIVDLMSFAFGWIVPLVIYVTKKDESPFVTDQAKEALNFRITIALIHFICGLSVLVTCGLAVFIALPIMGLVWVLALVFGIIASVKANDGERYRYPFCWRLVK